MATSDPVKEFRLLRQAEKNKEKRPALIFTEGATDVREVGKILSGGPPHFKRSRSAGVDRIRKSTAGFTLSRFMRQCAAVICWLDACALLPRQNAVPAVFSSFRTQKRSIKCRLHYMPWQLLCAPHLGYLEHLGSDWHVTMSRSVPLPQFHHGGI